MFCIATGKECNQGKLQTVHAQRGLDPALLQEPAQKAFAEESAHAKDQNHMHLKTAETVQDSPG
jgi:hypothetical protein